MPVKVSGDGDAPRRRRAVLYVSCLVVAVLTAVVAVWGGGSAEPDKLSTAEGGEHRVGNGPGAGGGPGTDGGRGAGSGRGAGGGTDGGPGAGSGRGAGGGRGTDGGPGAGSGGSTSVRDLGPRVIAWIGELGPTGGAGGELGDEASAYFDLAGGDCDHVLSNLDNLDEPSRSVYEGAASACLAAFHNRPQLWPRAQAALTTLGSQTSRLDCLDTPVHKLLQSLMEVHRQDPDAQFVTTFGSGEEPRCPRLLELIPDHGPRQGGYSVRLIGENLPPVTGIHFGKKYLTVSTNGGSEAVITVPPADEAATPEDEYDGNSGVLVEADGWPLGLWLVPPFFTYDPAERTENAPPASSSPPTS